MFNISSLLGKLSKRVFDAESVKQNIGEVVNRRTGMNIPLESIEIKNNIITVQASPAIKNKIFIAKKAILEEIATFSKGLTDIR